MYLCGMSSSPLFSRSSRFRSSISEGRKVDEQRPPLSRHKRCHWWQNKSYNNINICCPRFLSLEQFLDNIVTLTRMPLIKSCRLVCPNNTHDPIPLPDGEPVHLGRSEATRCIDPRCSRKQCKYGVFPSMSFNLEAFKCLDRFYWICMYFWH